MDALAYPLPLRFEPARKSFDSQTNLLTPVRAGVQNCKPAKTIDRLRSRDEPRHKIDHSVGTPRPHRVQALIARRVPPPLLKSAVAFLVFLPYCLPWFQPTMVSDENARLSMAIQKCVMFAHLLRRADVAKLYTLLVLCVSSADVAKKCKREKSLFDAKEIPNPPAEMYTFR